MVVISKKNISKANEEHSEVEKEWNNPKDPEKSEDQRDIERLERQAEEAIRRKENLTENPEDE